MVGRGPECLFLVADSGLVYITGSLFVCSYCRACFIRREKCATSTGKCTTPSILVPRTPWSRHFHASRMIRKIDTSDMNLTTYCETKSINKRYSLADGGPAAVVRGQFKLKSSWR